MLGVVQRAEQPPAPPLQVQYVAPVHTTNGPSATVAGVEIVGSVLALADQSAGARTDRRGAGPRLWRTELARLRRAGFTTVDLVDGWLPFLELDRAELAELRTVLDEVGLQPRGLSVTRISLVEPGRGEANLELTLQAVEVADTLGVSTVELGFHPRLDERSAGIWFWEVPARADDRSELTWTSAAERLAKVCAYAATRELQVSVELYEDSLLCTAADVEQLMARVRAPNLGVNPDLGNTYRSATPQREPWLDTLRGAAAHMNYWHVKNYTRSSAFPNGPFAVAPTALASGDLDYRLALRTVLEAGYRGPIVVEHYGGDALRMQELGRIYLERLLADWAEEQQGDTDVE